jgi:hypothetical protein
MTDIKLDRETAKKVFRYLVNHVDYGDAGGCFVVGDLLMSGYVPDQYDVQKTIEMYATRHSLHRYEQLKDMVANVIRCLPEDGRQDKINEAFHAAYRSLCERPVFCGCGSDERLHHAEYRRGFFSLGEALSERGIQMPELPAAPELDAITETASDKKFRERLELMGELFQSHAIVSVLRGDGFSIKSGKGVEHCKRT